MVKTDAEKEGKNPKKYTGHRRQSSAGITVYPKVPLDIT
jgi:hypothetical protein